MEARVVPVGGARGQELQRWEEVLSDPNGWLDASSTGRNNIA